MEIDQHFSLSKFFKSYHNLPLRFKAPQRWCKVLWETNLLLQVFGSAIFRLRLHLFSQHAFQIQRALHQTGFLSYQSAMKVMPKPSAKLESIASQLRKQSGLAFKAHILHYPRKFVLKKVPLNNPRAFPWNSQALTRKWSFLVPLSFSSRLHQHR